MIDVNEIKEKLGYRDGDSYYRRLLIYCLESRDTSGVGWSDVGVPYWASAVDVVEARDFLYGAGLFDGYQATFDGLGFLSYLRSNG
jgi:hypothetical protein